MAATAATAAISPRQLTCDPSDQGTAVRAASRPRPLRAAGPKGTKARRAVLGHGHHPGRPRGLPAAAAGPGARNGVGHFLRAPWCPGI